MTLSKPKFSVTRHPYIGTVEDARGDLVPVYGEDQELLVYAVSRNGVDVDDSRRPNGDELKVTMYCPSGQEWQANDEVTVEGQRYRITSSPTQYDGVSIDGQVIEGRWTSG